MKKKNVINLIKYYAEGNDVSFRDEAYEIANDFNASGDRELAEYIMALLSKANTFVPQINEDDNSFLHRIEYSKEPLPLPEIIKNDILGIVNAIGQNVGINKYLFYGAPGTGKTETVKQVARILSRELYIVDFDTLIDSKLGQTAKNISNLFLQLNSVAHPERMIVLFDEIDAIALDRTNSNDLREMGRATSAVLKGMDNLNEQIVMIATTNLYDSFDKALLRRFDSCIDFNRYSREDLHYIAEIVLGNFLNKFKYAGRNLRLFNKILDEFNNIPYPGELKNLIKSSIAFSKPDNEFDYLKRLYTAVTNNPNPDVKELQAKGYTVREIEILSGISKSHVSRLLQEA
ncbi:MAG: AAA family ATPase [Spirochaetia bacterium]|nr:AAA family ATPase [Spirochaetia bacterium]